MMGCEGKVNTEQKRPVRRRHVLGIKVTEVKINKKRKNKHQKTWSLLSDGAP